MTFRSDPDLVDACLRGDSSAWETLVDRYARLVWSTCRAERVPHADCEDLVQNVFASLVHRLGSVRNRDRLSSWLITAARRECWRWKRQRSADRRWTSADVEVDELALPASDPAEERRQLVREGLERLDRRCRELLVTLFSVAGEPGYGKVSRVLGMPIGGIGPTRARCLGKLGEILRRLGLGRSDAVP